MKAENQILRIAIQKAGRLFDGSIKLLEDCGIGIHNGTDQLRVKATDFPLELYFLRNQDIPRYVEDRVCDIAILGENALVEGDFKLRKLLNLGFASCRLSFAVPKESNYSSAQDLAGKKIATSYPNSVRKYLNSLGVKADIHLISGSVEIAPNIGLSDAICDLVSSGSTLFKNGLREIESVLTSQACLVAGYQLSAEQELLLQKLIFRIEAVLAARNNKYVLLNAPNNRIEKICELLPGVKSPTVMPLARAGWSSLHSVINEQDFWQVIDELKSAGAEGILIIPIEKMIR